MTPYNFGDVLFIDFPFADREESKRRPAVVVSSNDFHTHKKDLLLLAITSQLSPIEALGEAFLRGWQWAGLPKPSVLKANIATVVFSRVIRKFGTLSDHDRMALKQLITKIML